MSLDVSKTPYTFSPVLLYFVHGSGHSDGKPAMVFSDMIRQALYSADSNYLPSSQFKDTWCMISWWRHQMEAFSALLDLCVGNSPVTGGFPTQRPVTQSFDVFFDLRPNKWLSKQSWGWWFETLSRSLWRHSNVPAPYFETVQENYQLFIPLHNSAYHSVCYLCSPRESFLYDHIITVQVKISSSSGTRFNIKTIFIV